MIEKTCAICNHIIVESNDSEEHIIPRSIGGRKKVSGFICKKCNNNAGETWDAELAKQLNPLSLFLQISREGNPPPKQKFETTGEEALVLHHDGRLSAPNPKFSKTEIENGFSINLTARDENEFLSMLKGLKKKHPELDIEKAIDSAEQVSSYPKDMMKIPLQIGGNLAGRSIVKTALALAVSCGINSEECKLAIDYLQSEKFDEEGLINPKACFGYYSETDLVLNRPKGVPVHCVHVAANPDTKQLLGYVEYFGIFRIVVGLSDSYTGNEFSETYAINPLSGEQLNLEVDLDFSSEEIEEIYEYKMVNLENVRQAAEDIIGPAYNRSADEERIRVIEMAAKYAFENCGAAEGELLQKEHIEKLSQLMMEKLQPWILHQMEKTKDGYWDE